MISPDKEEAVVTKVKTRTLLTLLLYCISGSLLTLVNKLAIVAFPFPNHAFGSAKWCDCDPSGNEFRAHFNSGTSAEYRHCESMDTGRFYY